MGRLILATTAGLAYDDAMAEPSKSSATPPQPAWTTLLLGFRWPLVLIVLLVVGYLVYRDTLRQGEAVITGTAEVLTEGAENVARNLLTGNVTESFLAALPEIQTAGGGRLEVATAEAVETFERRDEQRVLWDAFSLGVTVSEIRVPVTYRYHVRLDDPWRVEVADSICIVYAPPVRATQPPAIHTEGMRKRVEEDMLRFDGDDQMAKLEESITPRLRQMAQDPKHINLVRDTARRTVGDFVRQWLLREDQWGDDRIRIVQVVFPDEVDEEVVGAPTVTTDPG